MQEDTAMQWLEITIDTAAASCDAVAAALTANGFSDLVIEDQQELEAFLEQSRDYWDYIDEELQRKLQGLSRIRLYLEADDQAGMARLDTVLQRLGLGKTVSALADENWAESWKDNYPPQEVGRSLVILPCWLADTPTARRKVILNPGLTFGTGAHPSTQMVLEVLEDAVKPGSRCLDLGSGSGILSIAALRLGAGSALGVDIDPKAEDAARENAAYNGFSAPEFSVRTGSVTQDGALMAALAAERYDLVLVNIVADVIIQLAPLLPELLTAEGSLLICSGILDSRLEEVRAALEGAGLTLEQIRQSGPWRCVTARRAMERSTL